MSLVVALRTNKWTVNEQRVVDQLSAVLGENLKVVFHNRPSDLEPVIDCVDINNDVITDMGLRTVSDWGWRCGDYAYYALRQAYANYDHYMLVEPDVYFGGKPSEFFDHIAQYSHDVIGLGIEDFDPKHIFARGVGNVAPKRAIFAMTRFSGRALDYAYAKRKEYSKRQVAERAYSNDEVFCFSYLLENADLQVADFSNIAPQWFENVQFDTAPDMLIENVDKEYLQENKILHPVVGREFFKKALAKRMVGRTGVLERSARKLQAMTPQDLDEIADIARAQFREHLRAFEPRT
jgi:hypothetical protein